MIHTYSIHVCRSPLSTISLGLDCLAQLIQEESVDRRELAELTTDCKSAATSAIQTLSDLLLFDKIENNMLHLDMASLDFASFLQQAVRPLERQVQLTGLEWRSQVDGAVRGAVVKMDRYKMEQVVRNFINNALKFTPAGGCISLTVCVNTVQDADSQSESKSILRVVVTDTGHGIPPHLLASLFGQYVQIDASKLQKGGGSGLGLWCK